MSASSSRQTQSPVFPAAGHSEAYSVGDQILGIVKSQVVTKFPGRGVVATAQVERAKLFVVCIHTAAETPSHSVVDCVRGDRKTPTLPDP